MSEFVSGGLFTVLAYLLGSVPFGILTAQLFHATDPRTAGSRNIGFTNVLRVCGKTAGVLTLVGDMGKGWLAGWGAAHLLEHEWWILMVAFSVVLGHLYSVFLGFKGGKGVATGLGAVLGVAPSIGLTLAGIWLAAAATWRYSSGAALLAFCSLPVLAVVVRPSTAFVTFSLIVMSVILWRHRGNIVRLWSGTEPRIGQRTISAPSSDATAG
jgi:glycerol-3-phosphate acyltransferase PlsY